MAHVSHVYHSDHSLKYLVNSKDCRLVILELKGEFGVLLFLCMQQGMFIIPTKNVHSGSFASYTVMDIN